ncbi:MAG: hypothetical protein ACFE8E_13895 [Candidatus Hodarchaeota archaeon]
MEILEIRKQIIIDLREDIPELVDKFNHFILKKLPSRRNFVLNIVFNRRTERFPKEFIIKLFKTENFKNEYNTLNSLMKQNLMIPKIIFYKEPYLFLEKVSGMNLCDFINDSLRNVVNLDDLEKESKEKIFNSLEKLASWLAQLHKSNIYDDSNSSEIIVLNKGDTRLRDFIYNLEEDIIFGLDFEDAYQGNHLDDIAWICCALLDTNPGIFELDDPKLKIDLLNFFLKSYYKKNHDFQFNYNYFAGQLIENLNLVMRRRNINLTLDKTFFIEEISKEV